MPTIPVLVFQLVAATSADQAVLTPCDFAQDRAKWHRKDVVVLAEVAETPLTGILKSDACPFVTIRGVEWENEIALMTVPGGKDLLAGPVSFLTDIASLDSMWRRKLEVPGSRVVVVIEGQYQSPARVTTLPDGKRLGMSVNGLYYAIFVVKRVLAIVSLK